MRRSLLVAAALVLVASATTIYLVHRGRVTSPHLLSSSTSSNISMTMSPQPVRLATLYAAVADPETRGQHRETLTFRSARVHFAENTAGATATVAICTDDGERNRIGGINVEAVGRIDEYCDPLVPIKRGTTMQWVNGSYREYQLVIIKPTKPGVARVDRITYDYAREGRYHQSGTDSAPLDLSITATR